MQAYINWLGDSSLKELPFPEILSLLFRQSLAL